MLKTQHQYIWGYCLVSCLTYFNLESKPAGFLSFRTVKTILLAGQKWSSTKQWRFDVFSARFCGFEATKSVLFVWILKWPSLSGEALKIWRFFGGIILIWSHQNCIIWLDYDKTIARGDKKRRFEDFFGWKHMNCVLEMINTYWSVLLKKFVKMEWFCAFCAIWLFTTSIWREKLCKF